MSWRGLVSAVGTLLAALGLGGFAFVASAPALPPAVLSPLSAVIAGGAPQAHEAAVSTIATASPRRPITRLVIDSIELDTEVVAAPLVEHDGTTTWDVPRFVAGHGEGTVGAGEPGNAVVIGHVTSLTLGHVFERLDRVKPGDSIVVYSAHARYDYAVTSARSVDRLDTEVLDATPTPTLTLVTCTGAWLPLEWDYAERFIVRAELIETLP